MKTAGTGRIAGSLNFGDATRSVLQNSHVLQGCGTLCRVNRSFPVSKGLNVLAGLHYFPAVYVWEHVDGFERLANFGTGRTSLFLRPIVRG